MSVLLNALKRNAAQSFLSGVLTKSARMYFYFSQTIPFDSNAAVEADSQGYDAETRNNIFALKEVLPSDASFVLPRVNYQSGISYLPYNTLINTGDYVYNASNFSIYICVKAGSSVSTVTPSHSTIDPVTLADGYSWRYIYTIPLSMRDRFLTSSWIPVSNVLSETFFSDGGINSVSIIDSGDGYDQGTTSVVVTGSSNKGHGAILEPVVENGKIVSIIIHETGYGYISPIISVSSPSATRTAVISATLSKGDIRSSQALIQTLAVPGTIESGIVTAPGSGYTSNVSVSINGDGTGAVASLTRNSTTGAITAITISDRGSNYTWANAVISDTPVVGGSGATVHLNLSPIQGFGRNPVSDLKASKLMVYHNLSRESIAGIGLENQIRKFGIIVNPKSTTNSSYPKSFVSKKNFITALDLSLVSSFPIGTVVYNEFPVTASTKQFTVSEQIIGPTSAGLLLTASNETDQLVIGGRYYKDALVSFVASNSSPFISVDRQFVSACYICRTTSPSFFNVNTFAKDTVLYKSTKRFVVIGVSSTVMLLSSIDGGTLTTGDTLTDGASNSVTPQTIENPVFDKKTGEIITIEKPASAVSYGQTQSVSFRTIIEF